MRQITFELNVPLGLGCSFRLIETRTVTEDQLIGETPFDKLCSAIRQIGCKYKIEDQPACILLEKSINGPTTKD